MREYIAFDSHKHYTWMEREEVSSGKVRQRRIEHTPGALGRALAGRHTSGTCSCPNEGVEMTGHDPIECSGNRP